jgi:hypothetical protein
MAELRLIMVKERASRTTRLVKPKAGVTPQASPMMSEPRFGSRNSALEMMPINLMVSSISLSRDS